MAYPKWIQEIEDEDSRRRAEQKYDELAPLVESGELSPDAAKHQLKQVRDDIEIRAQQEDDDRWKGLTAGGLGTTEEREGGLGRIAGLGGTRGVASAFINNKGIVPEVVEEGPIMDTPEGRVEGTYYDANRRKDKAEEEARSTPYYMRDELNFYNPEDFLYDDPRAAQLEADPVAKARQEEAMGELFGLWDQGGLTANERAKRADARRDAGQWLRGQREADLADLSERGMLGSGAEIASLLGARQGASDRISREDLDTAAWAEDRALQALLQGQEAAGDLRSTQWDEDRYVAESGDAVDQANKDLIRSGEQAKEQYFREQADKAADREFTAEENRLDRNVEVAGKVIDADNEAFDNETDLWKGDSAAATTAAARAGRDAGAAGATAGGFVPPGGEPESYADKRAYAIGTLTDEFGSYIDAFSGDDDEEDK